MDQHTEFIKNKSWSDNYNDQLKDILKENMSNLLTVYNATPKEDMKFGTDLVLKINGGTSVAVRIRRNITYRDVTIRSKLPSGYKTELDKIKAGHVDWYLYAWTDENYKIVSYIIFDVNKLRLSGILNKKRSITMNGDGTGFISIDLQELQSINSIKRLYNLEIKQTKIYNSKNIFSGKQLSFNSFI